MPSNKDYQTLEAIFKDSKHRHLASTIYPFRVLGMTCGVLPALAYAYENNYNLSAFFWPLCIGFIWPHIAYALTRNSKNIRKVETRNLLVDTLLAASLIPFMNFSILPSVVLCAVALADKLNSGLEKVFNKALVCLAAFLGSSLLLWDGRFDLNTSFFVMLATLPILIVHTLAVASSNFTLIRKVKGKNRLLKSLAERDFLTDVHSRAYWLFKAKDVIASNQHTNLSVLIIDVDHFKSINDRYGHKIGDKVLKQVAKNLRFVSQEQGFVDRLGGDEFAMLSFMDDISLQSHIRNAMDKVQAMKIDGVPDLKSTLSVGTVRINDANICLEHWIDLADNALYQAKSQGRDQVVSAKPA